MLAASQKAEYKVAPWLTSEHKAFVSAGGLLVQRLDGHTSCAVEEACMSSRLILQSPLPLRKRSQILSKITSATSSQSGKKPVCQSVKKQDECRRRDRTEEATMEINQLALVAYGQAQHCSSSGVCSMSLAMIAINTAFAP